MAPGSPRVVPCSLACASVTRAHACVGGYRNPGNPQSLGRAASGRSGVPLFSSFEGGGAQLSGARPTSSLELENELARMARKYLESFHTGQECSRKLGECSRKLGGCSRKLGFMRVSAVSGRASRKRSARGN